VLARYPSWPGRARRGVAADPQHGTVAGNLCQEPRCWYYRTPEDLFHCLRKAAKGATPCSGEPAHSISAPRARAAPDASPAAPPDGHPGLLELVRKGRIDEAARLLVGATRCPRSRAASAPTSARSAATGPASTRRCPRAPSSASSATGSWSDRPTSTCRPETKREARRGGRRRAGRARRGVLPALAGHQVTVFDDHPEAGACCATASPPTASQPTWWPGRSRPFGHGIRFELGSRSAAGRFTVARLRREHDALFLATAPGETGSSTWRTRSS